MSEQSVIKSKIMIDMVNKNPIEDGAVIFENGLITLSGHYEKIKLNLMQKFMIIMIQY